MSKENKKVADPLLGNQESDKSEKSETGTNVKTATPKLAPKTAMEKVKADAIAKFPKDIVLQTKYILDNSEHVNFIVPKIEGETGAEEVQINGYKLTIQKNVMVSIPKQVAQLIAEKYRINMTAGQEKRVDRATDVSEALG